MEKSFAWHGLVGLPVEIRKDGKAIARGIVDAAMPDSSIVWLEPQGARHRTLYEAESKYEVWMDPNVGATKKLQ